MITYRKLRAFRACVSALPLVAMAATGCAGPHFTRAFKTDRVEECRSLQVVASAPVEVPEKFPRAEQARKTFTAALSETLSAAGFKVIGPEAYEECLQAQVKEKGGIFDPVTGARDETKSREMAKTCFAKVQATTGAKALLRAAVVPGAARFRGCSAQWDGVTQTTVSGSQFLLCPQVQGTIPALSLVVAVEDPGGNRLFFNGGGIQLLALIPRFASGLDAVPADSLLADEARNREAVAIALAPLVAPRR